MRGFTGNSRAGNFYIYITRTKTVNVIMKFYPEFTDMMLILTTRFCFSKAICS